MSNITRKIRDIANLYRDRNKILIENGLDDFTFSDEEILNLAMEAISKEIGNMVSDALGV